MKQSSANEKSDWLAERESFSNNRYAEVRRFPQGVYASWKP